MTGTGSGLDRGASGDEVVAVVADDEEARPLIEMLLLAGLGPAVRQGEAGLEVTVVAGQADRAREVLEALDPEPGPFAGVVPEGDDPSSRGPQWSSQAVGTNARTARLRPDAEDDDGVAAVGPRHGLFRVLLLFALAMVLIPALAFYISYKASGG